MKLRASLFAALLIFDVAPARAQAPTPSPGPSVDLALVLAVDASGSVNQTRFDLQKHGYAQAFRSAKVIEAIAAGADHAIAVAMVQWTGPTLHVPVIDWTRVSDAASAQALADAIDATGRRLFGGGTSLSGAIDTGVAMLAAEPFATTRRVIDISGDGSNNRGRPAEDARDAAVKAGITINGLPISWIEPGLDRYYRNSVIGGPGAFVVSIDSYDNFADAILDKLVTEISGIAPPSLASSAGR
ncbi:MAG TPA: DUF1194 domain-containing protein [Stellaceae bacterium]|jgi:hypothetical protein|nr:DUF1194 domain-containing protein [Stellaceae bacterium]